MARGEIDSTDERILEILQRDGRRSYAELGAEIGMSAPSAHDRIRKLEARGIIRGYVASLDPVTLGLSVVGFMHVTQTPGSGPIDLSDAFATIPEIEECHRVAGRADYLLKIRAADTAHLESVIRRIQSIDQVFTTETDIALSSPFERRPLALERRLEPPRPMAPLQGLPERRPIQVRANDQVAREG